MSIVATSVLQTTFLCGARVKHVKIETMLDLMAVHGPVTGLYQQALQLHALITMVTLLLIVLQLTLPLTMLMANQLVLVILLQMSYNEKSTTLSSTDVKGNQRF